LKLNKPPNPNHVRGREAPKKMLKNNERIKFTAIGLMFQKIPFILSATDVLAEVTGMDGCRIVQGF